MLGRQRWRADLCLLFMLVCLFHCGLSLRRGRSKLGRRDIGKNRKPTNAPRPKPSLANDLRLFNCNFDKGYCGWRNDSAAEFNWFRTSNETGTDDTGPPWDHTKAGVRGKGFYLYIETSMPREYGDKARLVSPLINKAGTYCLTFWHHMHGSDVKDLNVYLKSQKSRKLVAISRLSGAWSMEDNLQTFAFGQDGDWWNEDNVQFTINAPSKVIFEGVRGKNYRGDIAIDDISLVPKKCPIKSIDCDFENNTCGWTQMANDDFNWLPNRGGTSTRDTGPPHDHTLGNADGRYLYTEASWPRAEGDKARLLSPPISCDKGATPVFNFWYNMHGPHVGPLKIYVTKDENRLGMPTWELSGQQGDKWFLGQVAIPDAVLSVGQYFKIAIEAERKEYQGDTAIDDVSLVGCREVETNFGNLERLTTPTTTVPPRTTRPTTTRVVPTQDQSSANDIPDGIGCNFEKSNDRMCAWNQDDYDHFDWELHQGKTHSDRTGPSSDHTTRGGWYLFLEASRPRKTGDTAIIRSPAIPSSIRSCLSFYYHMYGRTMGKLEVLTSRRGGSRFERKWWVAGQQSANDTDWKLAEVDIREAFNYEIIFRGFVGLGFYSDIAIDDISIQPMPCGTKTTTVPVTTATPASKPMDKPVSMPPGGQDENAHFKPRDFSGEAGDLQQESQHIVDCTFSEGNACNWTQVIAPRDEFNWSFATGGKTHSILTGPSADHTTGSSGGYAYIETSAPQEPGDRAIIESSVFEVKTRMCFRFWYHMFGNQTGELSIYRKIPGEDTMLLEWQRSGERGDAWLEARIDIKWKGKMSIVVEAKKGAAYKGDIAIDDFYMSEGGCEIFGCDFEDGICGWTQDTENDEFDWTRNQGNTSSKNTGPTFDSTTRNETGHYLFIEASNPRTRSDVARLITQAVDPVPNYTMCLSFWYHSYGKHVGAINVYKKPVAFKDRALGDPVWYVDTNEGDQWLYAQKTISYRPEVQDDHLPFQIVFEGVRGTDYMGDLAIDDVKLSDDKCEECCGDLWYKCGNNFCIPQALHCNGMVDCQDGSDESFCNMETTCGSPRVPPIIRQPEALPENIVRDENPFDSNIMPAPLEEEESPRAHDIPDLVNEKLKGFGDKVPLLTKEQAKRIAHPQLGFDLVIDAGYYAENVYRFSSSAGKPEAISIERRRRRDSSTRDRAFRTMRKRSIEKEAGNAQKTTKGNEEPISSADSHSDLSMTDLLSLQKLERDILSGKRKSENWQERANILTYTERKATIQATLGGEHLIPDDQWKLMTPSRKYMTRKEVSRARRSIKKIVGGNPSTRLNYPWQAAYYITDSHSLSHYFCGATLIDPYWVVTAAHCPHLGDEHVIVLGDYDLFTDEGTEQECIAHALFVNQKYTFSEDLVGDIALIQLKYPAKHSQSIIPACLLKPDAEPFPPGEICVSTGWGRVKAGTPGLERILKHVEMPIVSNAVCKSTFWSIFKFHDSYICAGGSGGNTCRGDSGGPLVCRRNDQFFLSGITSWGDTRCKPNIPGIYTRVQSYHGWMAKIIKTRTECTKND